MTVTTTWHIVNLERTVADGKVTVVHAGAYGSIGVDGDLAIPFKDLTETAIIGWVHDDLGGEKLAELEQALADQIEQQRAPKVAAGLPWAAATAVPAAA
ncbi:MAG: hypothetical protein LW834_06995 [Cyanobium sp. 49614_E6]|nr:hypothetical protein [Cyanobium sp. 49614_E6]